MNAVVAYDDAQYETAGEMIGEIMKIAGVKKEVEEAPVEEFSKTEMAALAQGLLKGTNVGDFDLSALIECIGDVTTDVRMFIGIVEALKESAETKNIPQFVQALIGIVAFGKSVEKTIPTCKHVGGGAQWETFDNIVEVMSTPETHMRQIGKDIVFNHKAITAEAVAAASSW